MKMSNTTHTPYLRSTDSMVFDNRYFMIGISYNFGNMKQIVKKTQRSIVNDDILGSSSTKGNNPAGTAGNSAPAGL